MHQATLPKSQQTGAYAAIRARILDRLDRGDPRAALSMLQVGEDLCASDPDYIFDRSRVHWALNDVDVALRLMTLAVEARPDDPERWGRLGGMYLSSGERKGAAVALRQAARLAPKSATILAALNRAAPLRSGGSDATRLKAIAGDKTAPAPERMSAENALGRIADRSGRHRAAFRHYLRAKGHSAGRYVPGAMMRHVEAQEALFAAPSPQSAASGPRVIFVVGVPRSGTSLMEAILDRHPDVAGIGESSALPEALALCRSEKLGGGATSAWDWLPVLGETDRARYRAAYLGRATQTFPDAPPAVIVDKLPLNAFEIGFAAQVLPDARFIHMSRHPLDVGLSNIAANYRDANAFSKRQDWTAHLIAMVARSAADYAAKLGETFRYQSYRRLVEEPKFEIAAVLDHAGLGWFAGCLAPEAGQGVVRTASVTQVREGINRRGLGKWKRYADDLTPMISALGGPDAIAAWEEADANRRICRFPAAESLS